MKKIYIVPILFLLLVVSTAVSAYWSDVSTISYKRGDNYSKDMGIPPIPKTTDNPVAQFEAFGKSSWSTPKACLVNSNNEERSAKADLSENRIYTVSSDATFNYNYYYKINGAWNQVGTDKMDFRFNPY